MFSFLSNCQTVLQRIGTISLISSLATKWNKFCTFWIAFGVVNIFHFSNSDMCVVISYSDFISIFVMDDYFENVFLAEMCLRIICLFSNWIFFTVEFWKVFSLLIFSHYSICMLFFSCIIALAMTSSAILNKGRWGDILALLWNVGRKHAISYC